MESAQSVFARDDTLLGACYSLGQDFGFNPLYLRVPFALGLFWSPVGAVSAYAACCALVAFSRWVAPEPRALEEDVAAPAGEDEREALAQDELPLAA